MREFRSRRTDRWLGALGVLVVLGVCLLPSLALGQSGGAPGEIIRPPSPGDPTPPNTIIIYVAVLLLGGAALGLTILPSRRTHQD